MKTEFKTYGIITLNPENNNKYIVWIEVGGHNVSIIYCDNIKTRKYNDHDLYGNKSVIRCYDEHAGNIANCTVDEVVNKGNTNF